MQQKYELPVAPPEQALLFAAAGMPSEARQSIEQALSSAPDWTRVIELALEHRMTPALTAALEAADRSLVPAELLEALQGHCNQLRAQSTAITKELFELLDALASDSILAVPFKGPLLGEFLFDDAGLRYPGDLDILTRRKDVSRFCETLEARGYVDAYRRPGRPPLTTTQEMMYRRFQCEHAYVRVSDSIVVEPHWALSPHSQAMDIDYPGMLARARPRLLRGRDVLTLAPEDLLLALCIHGSKHHWERLAWVRDVGALIARCRDLDFETCVERARSSGCLRLLLIGLALARRCTGVTLAPAVDRLIDLDDTAMALERQAVASLFDSGKESPGNDRGAWFRFMMRERWRDRIRCEARRVLWPQRPHLEMVTLPHSLRWMYFPLTWGHDFLALPLWRFLKGLTLRF